MNAKLFSEAITEVDNKYYEEAATYDYRVDNEVDTYSRAFALRRKLKTVLIAAVIMALAFSTVAAAAYLYHVFIANRHTELPSYEVGAKVEPKTISAYALEELKVKPYQTYKATYGEAEKYLDVDLLISEQLENTIFGQGVDIQGSYLKGENPITSVTLYSRHDTGATMSGYKVERRCHTYPQGIIKFFIGAFGNSFHQGQGVVDEIVHFSMLSDYLLRKANESFFLRQIADKIAVGSLVDHADGRAVFQKFLGDTFSNALCTASDDSNFVFKHINNLLW